MENISKMVVTQNEGKKIGFVLDLALDDDMQKIGYYVVDEESEGEFLVKSENIVSASNEIVLIGDVSSLEFAGERMSVLGKRVLGDDCQELGVVKKLDFSGKKCTKLVTDKCEILAKNVKNIGEDFVFVSFKRKKPARKNFGFPRAENDTIVQIQDFQKNVSPETVRLSTSFYVGRVCTQDIFGYNNEKIVLSGEVITRAVVEKARRHNKLNQLFFALKR